MGLLLAPAEGFNQDFLVPFKQKKSLLLCEEEEEGMERDDTECGDGEKTGGNQRPNQAPSRWDSCSSVSVPSVTSTSSSSTGSLLGLQALAAASAELRDQLSKPSLDVLGAWVLAPNSLYRAKCPK